MHVSTRFLDLIAEMYFTSLHMKTLNEPCVNWHIIYSQPYVKFLRRSIKAKSDSDIILRISTWHRLIKASPLDFAGNAYCWISCLQIRHGYESCCQNELTHTRQCSVETARIQGVAPDNTSKTLHNNKLSKPGWPWLQGNRYMDGALIIIRPNATGPRFSPAFFMLVLLNCPWPVTHEGELDE